jgi:hypothetical protein
LQSTAFTLSDPTVALTLADFAGDSFRVAIVGGVPRSSTGTKAQHEGGRRHLKLEGQIPAIPEPSTSVLMLMGLAGLAGMNRRLENRSE